MEVVLSPDLEEMVHQKVASGSYHSTSEVVEVALRLLKDHDRLREIRLAELREEIRLGDEEFERGEVEPFDAEQIIAEARAEFEAGR